MIQTWFKPILLLNQLNQLNHNRESVDKPDPVLGWCDGLQ